MNIYENMLPQTPIKGHRGYYPVCNKAEWEQLPDLYKVMEWETVKDPFDKNKLKAVKAVVFDTPYMEPYGMGAKIAVHPQEIQKILFCNFDSPECHLYSICEIELEGGTRLGAHWLQDSTTGAFGIVLNGGGPTIARQGGYQGFVPARVKVLEDGSFKYDFNYNSGKTNHYTLLNPFTLPGHKRDEKSLDDVIKTDEGLQTTGENEAVNDKKASKMKYGDMIKFLNDNGILLMQPLIADCVDCLLPIGWDGSAEEYEKICEKCFDAYLDIGDADLDVWDVVKETMEDMDLEKSVSLDSVIKTADEQKYDGFSKNVSVSPEKTR